MAVSKILMLLSHHRRPQDELVTKYCDMKRTKDARLVEDVHALRWV